MSLCIVYINPNIAQYWMNYCIIYNNDSYSASEKHFKHLHLKKVNIIINDYIIKILEEEFDVTYTPISKKNS